MNDLNSVLLEGVLVDDPVFIVEKSTCDFPIEAMRISQNGDQKIIQRFIFPIRTENTLAEICQEYLAKGRGVRIVGRLVQVGASIYILADHVEYKPPQITKSKKNEVLQHNGPLPVENE